MKKILSYIKHFIFVLLIILIVPYIISPVYDFKKPQVFSGKELYNPYKEIESRKCYKANFHAHSRAYLGLTSGSSSPDDSIVSIYKRIGYDIPSISDYMRINRVSESSEGYVPVYEHGYGIWKNHYLVIGAKEIKLTDFVLYQFNSNQQFIINRLKTDDNIVAIVHPGLRYAVTKEDLVTLSNYDCLEIFRHDREYLEHLDYALSAGRDIKILANDDCHNIYDFHEVGNGLNIINSKSLNYKDIAEAIKSGNNIGVSLKECNFNTFELKEKNIRSLPKLLSFDVKNDSIKFSFDKPAAEIKFIGQNGTIKKAIKDTASAFYTFRKEDTYIRTEIIFPDKIKYELNTVFRYEKENKTNTSPEISIPKSASFYVLWLGVITSAIYMRYRRRK